MVSFECRKTRYAWVFGWACDESQLGTPGPQRATVMRQRRSCPVVPNASQHVPAPSHRLLLPHTGADANGAGGAAHPFELGSPSGGTQFVALPPQNQPEQEQAHSDREQVASAEEVRLGDDDAASATVDDAGVGSEVAQPPPSGSTAAAEAVAVQLRPLALASGVAPSTFASPFLQQLGSRVLQELKQGQGKAQAHPAAAAAAGAPIAAAGFEALVTSGSAQAGHRPPQRSANSFGGGHGVGGLLGSGLLSSVSVASSLDAAQVHPWPMAFSAGTGTAGLSAGVSMDGVGAASGFAGGMSHSSRAAALVAEAADVPSPASSIDAARVSYLTMVLPCNNQLSRTGAAKCLSS